MKTISLALFLSAVSTTKIRSFTAAQTDSMEELYMPEVFEMKEENPYDDDKEYLETGVNLRLSSGFQQMKMALMLGSEERWVELPDCPEKAGTEIPLIKRDGTDMPENGSVATCKPRAKNSDSNPVWEPTPKADKNKKKNATANATANGSNGANATKKANGTNATKKANATNATANASANTTANVTAAAAPATPA
jgi:hypothetical protein